MQVVVTFRHMDPTDALREYAERKVGRVRKLVRRPIEAHVVLEVRKHRHMAEVTVTADGFAVNATEETGDLYSAIDLAMDKIERQVKKRVTKRQSRKHTGVAKGEDNTAQRGTSRRAVEIETERILLSPMSLHDAMQQFEKLEDDFLVFQNAANAAVSILYRRKNGEYALIEPEVG